MAIDFEFRKQIMDHHIGPDVIKYCYQCNRCTDNCPVSDVSIDFYSTSGYNPRTNILNSLLGYKDAIFSADLMTIWGCTLCDTCDELCPQSIELTEIFAFLKNESVKRGEAPGSIYEQANAIFETAKAVPLQPAIVRRRNSLGLPSAVEPDLNEVQTLLKNIGADKKLK